MVGQIFDRQANNFKIQRTSRGQGVRDFLSTAGAVFFLLLTLLWAIYIPNRQVELDYQIESARKTIQALQLERSALLMEESTLTSPARLDGMADQLGFQPINLNQVRFVDAAGLSGSQPARLALNTSRTAAEDR